MTKSERQNISIEKWRQANGKGTLNLIMRFGKTRIASEICKRFYEKHLNACIIAVAPNAVTTKNLKDNLPNKVHVYSANILINGIKKDDNKSCDLLILDEVHKLLSEETLDSIRKINYHYILCLTGSTLDKKSIDILNSLKAPIIDSISELEAIKEGWIANSIEYNLGIDLDEHDKVTYAKYTEQIVEVLNSFRLLSIKVNNIFKTKIVNTDFNLVLAAYAGVRYKDKNGNSVFIKPTIIRNVLADVMGWSRDMILDNDYNKQINAYWNPDNIYERAKKFTDFVRQRNNILIHNRPKINAVISILKHNSVPTICFNESIPMVEDLYEYFNKDGIAYHSSIESRYVINPNTGNYYTYKNGNPKKLGQASLKKLAIEGIKNGTYKYLFTAQSLNEGLTIDNIEQVITTGGSCNSQTHSQRIARGKTYDYLNPNKCCIIINLYIKDFKIGENEVKSRDKQKLIQRQSQSENIPIWVDNIDEIFN